MKAWASVRHLLGEATDLPGLLEAACGPDPEARRHARFGLRERLVSRGVYTTAAPRVVQELLGEVIHPETPEPAGLLGLLAEIGAAEVDRLAWSAAEGPPTDAAGAEVWAALDLRSIELAELATHDDPSVRAHAMQLISLAVPDAALPDAESDPAVEATLAIAHARRGSNFEAAGSLAQLLMRIWDAPPDSDVLQQLAPLLDPAPDPERFVWAGGELDVAVEALLSRHTDGDAGIASVFARAVAHAPDSPRASERARRVAENGFSEPIDPLAPELSSAQRDWADAILIPGRPAMLPGLPSRAIDARRLLGLDPPGPLEASTPDGPVWQVLSGVPAAQLATVVEGLSLPADLRCAVLIETLFGGHDLERAPADALTSFMELDAAWATNLLARIDATPLALRPWGRSTPPHANVARLTLAHHGIDPPDAPPIAFGDRPERVHRVLQTLGSDARHDALHGFLTDPARPDFQEAEVLDAVLPHLDTHRSLVPEVLNAVAALLARVHRSPEVERTLVAAWAWCAKHDVDATNAWRDRLSNEEQTRLTQAVEQVSPGST